MEKEIMIKPVGYVSSELKKRYETPRQGVLAKGTNAVIILNPKNNFIQALKDIDGFERLWIIYQFHLNENWKPLVSPPRYLGKKVGVFASRSPHRPNRIGLSCVKLEKVEGLKIYISESDILDGSPVLDIKPYLPYSDSFPGAATGWVKDESKNIFEILIEENAGSICEKIKNEKDINLLGYARVQLEFNPGDTTRKRISGLDAKNSRTFSLAYQEYRIIYSVDEKKQKVLILDVQENI